MTKEKAENTEQMDWNEIYCCVEIVKLGHGSEGKKRDFKWHKNIDLK